MSPSVHTQACPLRSGFPAHGRTENNPRDGKFTKTELAKYEHTWLGLPHLVCLGAEKNFLAFAERLEDEGEPLVDLNYFKHTVAKAILSRTAEKLFSTLQLDGYRANTVPYALSWLAERSSHRIDLDFVWEKQRVPAETQEAMKIVCQAAHRHLTQTIGNVGEWSKKTECWDEFRNKDTTVSSHWEQEWANTSYLAISSESEALKREWDQLRTQFVEDPRTLGELEALTGREWIARHRGDEARTHAARTWSELKGPGGRRYKNIRAFLELFSAAAKLAGDR